MTTLLIKNGRVVDPKNNFDEVADIFVEDGKIAKENAVDVRGYDFRALNYGRRYGRMMERDHIKISIQGSAEDIGYSSVSPADGFPANVTFRRGGRGFREISHLQSFNRDIGGMIEIKSDLTLDEFVQLLRDGGMRFEGLDDLSAPKEGLLGRLQSWYSR